MKDSRTIAIDTDNILALDLEFKPYQVLSPVDNSRGVSGLVSTTNNFFPNTISLIFPKTSVKQISKLYDHLKRHYSD